MSYDLTLGRLGLPTLTDDLKEGVGDPLEIEGTGVALGKRRVKPYAFNVPIHGETSDGDPYGAGLRLRRQLRSMLQNGPYRGQSLYLYFGPDSELNGWVMVGAGDIQYANGGISLGEFQLTLDEIYRVGSMRTHRPARRLEQYDRRLSTTPRDYLGLYYSTDFASLTPLAIAYLPSNISDVLGLNFQRLAPAASIATADGGSISVVTGLVHGTVVHYEQAEANRLKADVTVLDMRNLVAGLVWNPSFENGLTRWQANNSSGYTANSLTVSNAWALNGSQSALVTATCPADTTVRRAAVIWSSATQLAITPGQSYTMRSTVNITDGSQGRGYQQRITWYDSGGVLIVTSNGQEGPANATGVISMVDTFTAPANAAYARPDVGLLTSVANDTISFYIDSVQITPTTNLAVSGYVDGDTAGYSWSGTPHDSTTEGPGEEVYGPDYPLTSGQVPDIRNERCRVRFDTTNSVVGFRVDVWTGSVWQEQGKIAFVRSGDAGSAFLNTLVSAAVVEYSPERAVLEVVLAMSTDVRSHERVYVSLQRGWTGPRIDYYLAPKANGTNAAGSMFWDAATTDTNDSLVKIGASGAGAIIATAGSGSANFSTTTLGASFFDGENEVAFLRQGASYQANFAVLQLNNLAGSANDSSLYGVARNALRITDGGNNPGWLGLQIGFSPLLADQIMEAESMTLGTGVVSAADGAASGGNAATSTATADQVTVSRATWPNNTNAKHRVLVRVKTTAGTLSVYAKAAGTNTVTATKTTTSTTYVWLDLGDLPSSGTLEIHAWLSVAGTLSIDRVETVKLEDRTQASAANDGARDLGQAMLYDARLIPELVQRT